jgi:PEP-CTERM motif
MNTSTFRPLALFLLVAAFSFAANGSLWAAALNFDDTAVNDTITVSANDFEFGSTLNGNPFQQGLNNPASAVLKESDGAITFTGTWITGGAQPQDSQTVYLIESPSNAGTAPLVSDVLRYTIIPNTDGTATIDGTFVSDFEDNLGFLPTTADPRFVFVETGQPIVLGFAALSISIASDVNVPEPSTFVLFGFALVGALGYCVRRKRFA